MDCNELQTQTAELPRHTKRDLIGRKIRGNGRTWFVVKTAHLAPINHRRSAQLRRLAEMGKNHSSWYERTRLEVIAICDRYGWSAPDFFAVLAASSPRVAVTRNVRITAHTMATGRCPENCLGSTIRATTAAYLYGTVSGQKVRDFHESLIEGGRTESFTLDVHMATALRVRQESFATQAGKATAYAQLEHARRGMSTPMLAGEFQAAVWAGLFISRGLKVPQTDVTKLVTEYLRDMDV